MNLDFATGLINPSAHTATRRLRDVGEIFEDRDALAAIDPETVVYQTYGCPGDGPGQELYFGTTVLMPGRVGSEFFMTRGHFHTHPLRGELCLTLGGTGKLILMARDGATRTEDMAEGSIHNIPPETAHRVANTGKEPLIFFVAWMSDCGHDYESIRERGFGLRFTADTI
jgi:glucose-6-phosphate isomerase, archaeal